MKAFCVGLVAASLIALTGCNTSSSGGKTGESGGGFKLKAPSNVMDTELKRKEPKTLKITVDADKNFKEDIAFTTSVDPADHAKALKVEVKPANWKASDPKEVELHLEANDDTPKGEYTIHVNAKPAKGNPTSVDVKVKVPEKK